MKRDRRIVDRKRAASGESADDATIPLGPQEKLTMSKPTPHPLRRSTDVIKAPVEGATELSTYRTVVSPIPHIFIPDRFKKIMDSNPSSWTPGLENDVEIFAAYGLPDTRECSRLAMGDVRVDQLITTNLNNPLSLRSRPSDKYEKLIKFHPMVYMLDVHREDIVTEDFKPFDGVVVEIGFFVKAMNETKHRYLGKTKEYFPKNCNRMRVHLDASKLR